MKYSWHMSCGKYGRDGKRM